VTQCLVLERGGDSPEGYHGRPFGGPLRLLDHGPFFASARDHTEHILWFVSLFIFFLLFFERGVFLDY
jgi:hypothetical protein